MTTHPPGEAAPYVRNPLTGEVGIYLPWEGGKVAQRRPLPRIPREVLASDCVLCHQLSPVPGELVSARPNPHPLSSPHVLVSWVRHMESPQQASEEEWVAYVDLSSQLMGSMSHPISYANLGLESGASQPHLHGHVLSGPDRAREDLTTECGLCARQCPELARIGDWSACSLPGGGHAEMVLYHQEHSNTERGLRDLAALISLVWSRLGSAGWTSGRLLWHRPGHSHVHIQPSVTAEGALESVAGIRVSRYGHDFLKALLTD